MRVLAHQYLLERLSPSHPTYPIVAEKLRLLEAGKRGEERLLNQLQYQEHGFALHDVSLELGNEKVQIDCLFFTSKCCLVLESKNISGDLYFDEEADEFYRLETDKSKTYFSNPYYQLTRHIRFMDKWLKHHRVFLPVNGAVFLTSKSVTLRNNPSKRPFYKIESFFERIDYFQKVYQKAHLSHSQLHSLIKQIRLSHKPRTHTGLLAYYNLSMSDIIKGIVCPACRKSSLKKELKIWVCERCNHTTKTNLQKAVEQYLLVVKPTINNKEFRDFFGVESVKSANNLLAPLILKKHGGKRNRFYSLMEPINF